MKRYPFLIFTAGIGVALLAAGATPAAARQARAEVRAGEIDDECDVELPKALPATDYERARHKRGRAVSLALGKGVALKLVSTVQHTVNKRRVAYHVYRWSRGGASRHFLLERRVPVRVKFNGKWRTVYLLPRPKPGARRDPPELVTSLKVVR